MLFETSAGINSDGTFTPDATTNYLTTATSIKDANKKLDTQLKATQDEVNNIETSAGINADGTFTADANN